MCQAPGSEEALSSAGAPPPQPVITPAVRPVDEPMSLEEAQMDVLDFVNLRVFGNAHFRQQQRAVVETVVEGMNAFVLMPTGGGEPGSLALM